MPPDFLNALNPINVFTVLDLDIRTKILYVYINYPFFTHFDWRGKNLFLSTLV